MKICSVSDVHASKNHFWFQADTPDADVLTVSGDLTRTGSIDELVLFREWLVRQPQKHKIVIAGNHDFCLEDPRKRPIAENILGGNGIVYLNDQEVKIDGVRFYGSPWQPWFHDWAFNLKRGPEIAAKWALIPDGIDVLLVHGPPRSYGDRTTSGENVGCSDLMRAIEQVRPQLVCFGHIHEDTGAWILDYSGEGQTKLVNCSVGYLVGPKDKARRCHEVTILEAKNEAK